MPTCEPQTAPQKKRYTVAEWLAEATRRFGPHGRDWKFVCPICGTVASGADYVAAGLTLQQAEGQIAFSCIGRSLPAPRRAFGEGGTGAGPCDYTTGGLLNVSPITIVDEDGKEHRRFAFAEETQ